MADPQPADDVSVTNEADLWRRSHPKWWVPDENTGGRRITSEAFQDDPNGAAMSVTIASEVTGPEVLLAGHPGYGVAGLIAGWVRSCGQIIVRQPEAGNPGHAHVVGDKPKGVRKRLRNGASIVVPPDVT